MKKRDLYAKVIEYFQEAMPVAETELHYENSYQLLVAVILRPSAPISGLIW